MAKNVKINGVTYESVPQVSIPLAGGTGTAEFYDTTSANAVAADIRNGKTAFLGSGSVTGTMADNGAVAGSISTVKGTYTVPSGYHNGNGTVSIAASEQSKIIAGNIKVVTLLGIAGKSSVVDTADATAAASTIVSGKTAYINGSKVTGSLTSVAVSQDSLTKSTDHRIKGDDNMKVDVKIAGASYNEVPSVLLPLTAGGKARFCEVSDTTAEAGDVAKGKKFYTADGELAEGTLQTTQISVSETNVFIIGIQVQLRISGRFL